MMTTSYLKFMIKNNEDCPYCKINMSIITDYLDDKKLIKKYWCSRCGCIVTANIQIHQPDCRKEIKESKSMMSGWHNYPDEIPDINNCCLVWGQKGYEIGYHTTKDGGWHWYDHNEEPIHRVKHFMYIEPPEEE